MKTIKLITLLTLFLPFIFHAQQKKVLSKEQTVQYINDLHQKTTGTTETVSLEGKTLVRTNKSAPFRTYLLQGGSLIIEKSRCIGEVACIFFSSNGQYKFTGLYGNNDEDAKRLRNALEHLI